MRIFKYFAVAILIGIAAIGPAISSARAAIINPSFEDDPALAGWATVGAAGFTIGTNGPVSDGLRAARVFNKNSGTVNPGEFGELRQSVDMTNIMSITFDFDARYNDGAGGIWDASRFLASATIDGVDQRTFNTTNTFFDEILDVSSLIGFHDLGFRLTSLTTTIGTGRFGADAVTHQIKIDNIRSTLSPVPLPAALQLFLGALAGLGGLGLMKRRRQAA